jgi:hypothetical protein
MNQKSSNRSMSLGDLVALAFDTAEAVTPNPEVAAVLATLAVDSMVRRHRGRRVAPRLARAA